ncbi:MAG: guanylate kinase [Pirellulales bacterium]|nr:guanylate kinase [Pirellulales bacterium]
MAEGRLIIVSGPAGAGKTTVLREAFRRSKQPLVASVSATTRPPRPGEVDGEHYHFLSHDEFARRREAGDFLECFEVFGRGYWYGTLRSEVATGLDQGNWVVLEVDVQGMVEVSRQYPEAVSIFIRPSSIDELERRLRARGTEDDETINVRLGVARDELVAAKNYTHHVINDDIDEAVDSLCNILDSLAG